MALAGRFMAMNNQSRMVSGCVQVVYLYFVCWQIISCDLLLLCTSQVQHVVQVKYHSKRFPVPLVFVLAQGIWDQDSTNRLRIPSSRLLSPIAYWGSVVQGGQSDV